MKISISELTTLTNNALLHYGYTEKETNIISEVLLYAQLRGNNQGIVKLINKGIPKNPEAKPITVIKETKLSALLDGGQTHGMLVMKHALDMAISKCNNHGISIIGTRNTSTSTGALGYYAYTIAEAGFIGFIFAGSSESTTTYGSFEAVFGTNPLAIGVPSDRSPIVLDMATAAMAYYGLIEAKTAGRSIPPDIAYDADGNLTTDPALAMDGALRTFDKNYKSAGLSFMVEVLTGPLVKAAFVGIGENSNWGNLMIAIDPELFGDREEFKKNMYQMAVKVKSLKKLPGVKEILLPGERGDTLTKLRMSSGVIEVEDNLLNQLRQKAG